MSTRNVSAGGRRGIQVAQYASAAVLALVVSIPLVAQTAKGWKTRVDYSTNASDPDAAGDITFVATGSGFHATTPEAAVFWNPANTVAGNYSLKATFTLMKPAGHVEYYGLVFGGSNLEGSGQNYLYFMVAQNGTWLVKQRDGETTQNLSAKTASDAVKTPDASGKSTNALEVRVTADKIAYLVNGTAVYAMPKTGPAAKTDGIYGIRINHHLEVQVDRFAVSKQ